MKAIIVYLCVLFFGSDYLVKINGFGELAETTPEAHPFHAVVKARIICNGILITNNYVITAAICVDRWTSATVYLGFNGYPLYIYHHLEPNVQIISSSDIILHEDFANIQNQHYLNNIALVKLSKPATLSATVQPGTLLSRQESYLVEGKYAVVSGWKISLDENKKMATVQIRNRDTCSYLFEGQFLSSQEFCVKWFSVTRLNRLNLIGNSIRIGDNIIGFQTYTPRCTVSLSGCTSNDMFLNLIPFLDWMSQKMHVPIEKFTSKSHESCVNHDVTKMEDLGKKINETLYNEINNFKNNRNEVAALKEKIETELQNAKTEQNKFALSLNEQMAAISTEINNNKIKIDQNITNLQEELNSIRTVVTGGLIAEQSLNDLQAELSNLNDTVQLKINEQTDKFEERIKDVAIKTNNNELAERVLQLQKDATKLFKKLQDTEITQQAVDEQIGYVNTTIENILSEQHLLQSQFNYNKEEFKNHLSHERDYFAKLEKTVVDTIKAVEDNKLEAKNRLGEIEKAFDEQRHHMDLHIVQESTVHQSLKDEIKSMNVKLNKFVGFIYDDPLSA